ncbi:MAG: hypothetical protein ACYSWQ_14505 [Planctomycetota bacterium]
MLDRYVGPIVAPYWWSFVWAGGLLTGAIIIVGSRFTTPYPDEKLKGLCWVTTDQRDCLARVVYEPDCPLVRQRDSQLLDDKKQTVPDWRLWSVVSLVVGVSLTLLFWLVF